MDRGMVPGGDPNIYDDVIKGIIVHHKHCTVHVVHMHNIAYTRVYEWTLKGGIAQLLVQMSLSASHPSHILTLTKWIVIGQYA